MAEKQAIIIKKVQGGGHAAAHGGSWKVAYADFVTAMMCFFMVMWLMGADEETKAAIENYFNNPNIPWKSKDSTNSDAMPMGEREGQGDELLKGLSGLYPEDMINRAVRPFNALYENESIAEQIKNLLDNQAYGFDTNPDFVKFSVAETVLFKVASSELLPESKKNLDRLAGVFKEFNGVITIEGHTDASPQADRAPSGGFGKQFQLSFDRALAVMKYLVEMHDIGED
ncbi:MAG: flagellar motor protein MotB, partial [Bdellovibrionota bacterium]